MASTNKKVALIGGTGVLGSVVVKELLHSGFEVTVVVRPQSKAVAPNISVKESDFSEESLASLFRGHQAVISTIGGAAIDKQKVIIDAAVEAGVQRFIPSEYGCNTSDPRVLAAAPILQSKRDVALYLQSKEEQGLEWTSIITGPFIDWQNSFSNFLGFNTGMKEATIWDGGENTFHCTTLGDTAKAISAVLKHQEQTKNRYVYVGSMTATQNQIVATLEELEGGKRWTTSEKSSQKESSYALGELQEGRFSIPVISSLLKAVSFGSAGLGHFGKDHQVDNDILGIPQEDIAIVLKKQLDVK